jgi:hypothetical protein
VIAALLLVMFWPVPIEAKPFPPRPASPTVVSIGLIYPSVAVETNFIYRSVWPFIDTAGIVENGMPRPITVTVVDWFTDSCGHFGHFIRTYDLAPYERITAYGFAGANEMCLGLGSLERTVLVDGQIPRMSYAACAAAGLQPVCWARLDVPVWVQP